MCQAQKYSLAAKDVNAHNNHFEKMDRFENADCWFIEDCGHDHSPHKNTLFLSLYLDCDHDYSLHKNAIYFSLYRTTA